MGCRFGEFEFDPVLFELRRAGRRVALERQVFDVLGYLIDHRDRVVTKEELLDEVWGDRFVSESALTTRIKAVRRALGDDGRTQRMIETTRGRGYRFIAPIDGESAAAPLRPVAVVRNNLPIERTELFGRDAEITQICELVDSHRLVTLLGIGGTGKTRLAVATAVDRSDDYDDGVWFVDLVPATSIDEAAEAVASAAGLTLSGPDLAISLADLIRDRRMLVILDNCEHITYQVADLLDDLLERTSASHWLATSREPLQLSDERQVHVAPLAVAVDLAAPALQLFVSAAERVGAEIRSDDAPLAALVCTALDGLPLSIELAAAQLRHLTLPQLAARLDHRFEILARGGGGRSRRHDSLQAVLNDTWDMLDRHEHELLLQLAAFPSAFTVDDVEGISAGSDVGVPTLTLAGLIDRSLVAAAGVGRYRLLETVKLFARQQWDNTSAPDSYLERHTTWVVEHLGAYRPQDWFTSFALTEWTSAHYDDHRAVEDRLADAGRTGDLAMLMRSLTITYTYATGTRASSVIDRIERHLARLELSDRERGLLELVAASSGLPSRRADVIRDHSTAAVAHLERDGAPEERAAALIVGSWMVVFRDPDEAIAMLADARRLAEGADAVAIANAAIAYHAGYLALIGRIDDALEVLETLRRRLAGTPFDYAWSLHLLFNLAVHVVRDPELARTLGERLVAGFPSPAWDGGIGWGLPLCNCMAIAACGDVEATRHHVAATETASRLASDHDGLPDLLLAPAALAWRIGDHDRARRWVTAVRRSPKPTANFQLSIMYRQLRSEVGLDDVNPLDSMSLHDVYREAVAWMDSLAP